MKQGRVDEVRAFKRGSEKYYLTHFGKPRLTSMLINKVSSPQSILKRSVFLVSLSDFLFFKLRYFLISRNHSQKWMLYSMSLKTLP